MSAVLVESRNTKKKKKEQEQEEEGIKTVVVNRVCREMI